MNVVRLLLLLVLSTGRRGLSVLRLRAATGGDGRGPGAEWSAVENLIIRFAFILNKMGVAVGGTDASMPCQLLRQLDTFGAIDGGNEEMTEIMWSDVCFRVNPSLGNAALYEVPHIAGSRLDNLFARLLAVMDKHGRGFTDRANTEVFPHSSNGALGDMHNSRLVTLASDKNVSFEQIHIIDAQPASLRDAQAAIRQKQNIRSISKFLGVISYSGNIINGLLDGVHVWVNEVLWRLESVVIVNLIEERHIDAANCASRVPVEPTDSRTVQGLCSRGHVGSAEQKFYIRIFRELCITANHVNKFLQSGCVGLMGLFAPRLIHETQKGAYGIIQGNLSVLHNANYIRKCLRSA
jgi:hypothetical protein